MKGLNLILLPILALTLSSCATIRFGRTTTVTIETEHPGDVVDILAIGPKKVVDLQQVTLPYKYKVRHNNLPQRIDIVSDDYIYEPLTIGAQKRGQFLKEVCRPLGWAEMLGMWALMGGIGYGCGSPETGTVGMVAGAVVGGPLLAIGYTAETDIPDHKFYLTSSIPVDSTNMHQLEGWYLRQRALEDVYTLLSHGEYKLSKAKASFLLEGGQNAELYYLRGISSYYLGEHKKALTDLNEALNRLNVEINPGLQNEVSECISAVETSISLKSEKRSQMWSQIAGAILQTGMETFSTYQQMAFQKSNTGYPLSSAYPEYSITQLSKSDLNTLIDPNYAVQQILSQEMQQYQQFCRYNKKPDGSDYSLDDFRAFQGAVIQQAKEDGYDILAEQRRQMEVDRQARADQRKKDKTDWFARYGYNISASSATGTTDTSSSHSSISRSTSSHSSDLPDSKPIKSESVRNKETQDMDDQPKLDARQQFKRDPVSSDDYQRIKSVTLYYRDGNKARKMDINAELYKKGAYMYVKIGNKFYPRLTPSWMQFRNAIVYGDRQLYYND